MMDKILFSSSTAEYGTPSYLFKMLHSIYNFTLDPCSSNSNYKCDKHYTVKENGLAQPWDGEIVFMNPPFSRKEKMLIDPWVQVAAMAAEIHNATVIGLLPARTDTGWFQDFVFDFARELFFIRGRLKFELEGAKYSATFPSVLAAWGSTDIIGQLELVSDYGIKGMYVPL